MTSQCRSRTLQCAAVLALVYQATAACSSAAPFVRAVYLTPQSATSASAYAVVNNCSVLNETATLIARVFDSALSVWNATASAPTLDATGGARFEFGQIALRSNRALNATASWSRPWDTDAWSFTVEAGAYAPVQVRAPP